LSITVYLFLLAKQSVSLDTTLPGESIV